MANARWFRGLWFGRGGARIPAPGRITQSLIEYGDKRSADARVTSHAVEYGDKRSADARVTSHTIEALNGQPADTRVTAFVVEVLYRSTLPPAPFPGWGTCPPTDPAVTPGRGDGKTAEDLPFSWTPCVPE